MNAAACPTCRAIHEATSALALVGLNDDQRYRRTHCVLCETPSSYFLPIGDLPDPDADEFGYPLAVVPWMHVGT